MVTTIRTCAVKKARKRQHCNAWERYLEEHSDMKELGEYKCSGINVGDSYEYQVNVDMRELWKFKSCLKCQAVAKEYNIQLYDEY